MTRPRLLVLGLVSVIAFGGIAFAALSGPQRRTASMDDAQQPLPYLHAIADGAEAYVEAHHALPQPLPRTPAEPVSTAQPWPANADPRWAELSFQPDVVHYSYELTVDGEELAIRARGDHDGDGVESLFERSCGILDGVFRCSPGMYIEREAE